MTIALVALASTNAGMATPVAGQQTACEEPDSQVDGLRKAFFFAFPLYEMTRMRQRMLSAPGAEANSLRHRTTLSRPSDRTITTPNNDTLYSTAWLDLSTGPVEFSIPPMGSRYHSVQLMHAFSDVFAMLRNDGDEQRTYLIVGPQWHGRAAEGQTVVRSPTRDAWLVIRIFVAGPADPGEAQRLQSAFALVGSDRPIEADATGEVIPASPDALTFLSVVNAALARGSLPPDQHDRLACFAKAGMDPVKLDGGASFDPALIVQWDANIPLFYQEARMAFEEGGSLRHGWRYPAPDIAAFGTDDLYRSAMALGGLAAMPPQEALNPLAVADADGKPLTGQSRYRLRIPGQVPVDGFWSLTLYQAEGSGRWFLYDNPINRYAIGSTTANLQRGPGGSIDVELSHDRPAGSGNWLPAPKGGFMVVFRAYRPRRAFINGSFRLPAIERIE